MIIIRIFIRLFFTWLIVRYGTSLFDAVYCETFTSWMEEPEPEPKPKDKSEVIIKVVAIIVVTMAVIILAITDDRFQ